MADLAPNDAAIAADLRNQPMELPAMRIGMAHGAGPVIKVIAHRRGLPGFRLVALGAVHASVSSRQLEAGAFVSGDVEGSAAKSLDRVAIVTAVEMGRTAKLRLVRIFVAIRAGGELQPEDRGLAGRLMALGAGHGGMFFLQRKSRCRVVAHRKTHRLEAVDSVASVAFTFVRPFCELPRMRVRLVTVRTFVESQGPLEVSAGVTFQAVQLGMFTS